MISLIDIGNTAVKVYNCDGKNFLENFYILNKEIKYNELINMLNDKVIITSVVPEISNELIKLLPIDTKVKVITHDDKFLFDFDNYEPKNSIGIDRLLAMQGAVKDSYDKDIDYQYLVVVTVGTAITINVIDNYYKFVGGMIYPGPATMIKSLNYSTSLLPDFDITKNFKKIELATNTKDSIIAGVMNSSVLLIKNMNQILNSNDITYYITGGYAYLYRDYLQDIIFDDYLIAKGLLTFSIKL